MAARLRQPQERLRAWEAGTARPSLPQARKLATLYRRPLGLFYLNAPPAEEGLIPDYRFGPAEVSREVSPSLRWTIRRLRGLRAAALELAEDPRATFPTFPLRATTKEAPQQIAERLRSALGVTVAAQTAWRSVEEAWTGWRDAIERIGCLVFVADHVEEDEMAGISLPYEQAPVIAVNGSVRFVSRRVFTLMHELAHLSLRAGGVCKLDDATASVEALCNRTAAEALLPRATFLARARALAGERRARGWADAQVTALAREFNVSKQAVFVRLLTVGLATETAYRDWRSRYGAGAEAERSAEKAGEGKPTFYQLYLHRMSSGYLQRVFEAYGESRISLAELSDHLGVKPSTSLALQERFLRRMRRRAS